ncbi:MAG TPA: DNA primase [Actinocatenispora sp.]
MARHRAENESDVPSEAESDAESTDVEPTDAEADDTNDPDDSDDEESTPEVERSAEADAFWADVRVDPIEIALPAGVGYTLRAYRDPDDVTGVAGAEPESDEEPAAESAAEPADEEPVAEEPDEDDESADDEDADDETADDDESDEDEDEEEEDEEPAGPDEVPVFLSQRGKLLLFRTPEGLVDFVRSDEPHALRGIDSADALADRIEAAHVVPSEEDRYELDLLVGNLRGGHDSWEPDLVISAGELARDVAYAFDLSSVLTSLSAGSPLDDLDEAMRGATKGGLSAFRARRRAKKIGAQQAALAWRTIIGKIGAAVDWRD